MSSHRIELPGKGHVRSRFDCGESKLNEFLRSHAGQDSRRNISKTYVVIARESNVVLGFYTLSAGCLAFENLPQDLGRRLPRYPIPTIHLGRLAVDQSVQGYGLGSVLLLDALKRAQKFAEHVGVCGVTVDAKDSKAKHFYGLHGFLSLRDDTLHMFLPMAAIRKL